MLNFLHVRTKIKIVALVVFFHKLVANDEMEGAGNPSLVTVHKMYYMVSRVVK